jgi:lipid-binding SYLF domain-containing protein
MTGLEKGLGRLITISTTAVLALALTTGAQAASRTEERVSDAIDVLQDFTAIPEQGIPPNLLANAHAVAVIPGVIKAGFGLGGRYGKGILIVRQDDGAWSNPAFVTLGGASFGWQLGAQSTDLLLVFKDQRSIEHIADGKLTLGGDASIAAGPLGRSTSAATDQTLTAEIFSYSRSRGLFAGVALDGTWIGMDRKSNEDYYGNGLSPMQILSARNIPAPMSAQQFVRLMAANAPRIDMSPAAKAAAAVMPAAGSQDTRLQDNAESDVRTYALDPVETAPSQRAGDETMF